MSRARSNRLPDSDSSPSATATSPCAIADLAKTSGGEQGDCLSSQLDRFLRESEVLKLTGLSRTTRWRLARRGEFPKAIRLSENASGWLLSEIIAWMCAKTVAREAASASAGGAS